MTSSARTSGQLGVVLLAASLALLLAHALHYAFLTDDAFISFRYAMNLAEGRGLVFNPGEFVEGYTNFLWVLLLAFGGMLGVAPESLANPMSLTASIGLWAVVALHAVRSLRSGESLAWAAVPCLLLAVTRSVAVWSTGGLETRLFELCLVAGCVELVRAVGDELRGSKARMAAPTIWFALACLTRPDALLVTAACGGAALSVLWRRERLAVRHLRSALVLVAVVAAHFCFRRFYYGDWLPNTFYAKVGGGFGWEWGLGYLAAFVLEYAAWSWIPLLVLGVQRHRREGTGFVPLLFGAAVVPHAAYIVSIGGDHFEYRPFDLYFPFAFLLIADGLRELADRSRLLAASAGAIVVLGLVAVPWQLAQEAPEEYVAGFPGMPGWPREAFGAPERGPLRWIPGNAWLQSQYQDLLWPLTRRFVGNRQEEHAAFLASVRGEGAALRGAVERGLLREDTRIAIHAIGAISYESGLPVLDRLGLTDRTVARSEAVGDLLAHQKMATLEYARSRGVDFWAVDLVHLVYDVDDPFLPSAIEACRAGRYGCVLASLSDRQRMLAVLPQGLAATRRRYPSLELVPVADAAAVRRQMQSGTTTGAAMP